MFNVALHVHVAITIRALAFSGALGSKFVNNSPVLWARRLSNRDRTSNRGRRSCTPPQRPDQKSTGNGDSSCIENLARRRRSRNYCTCWQSQSYLTTVGQSASLSLCQAAIRAHDQVFFLLEFFLGNCWSVILWRPLWREDGSVIYCCCWAWQSFSVWVLWGGSEKRCIGVVGRENE
jgi:hypothetical protein